MESRNGAAPSEEPVLPHALALTWGIAEQPQRGPRRELSIEKIVDAAIEMADAEGLGAVSMARVAAALGYTTMSLYRYVTSKDDLLLLMEDAVYAVPLSRPEPGTPWRPAMRALVDACMTGIRAHPWAARLPIRGVPMTPNNLYLVDYALGAMAGLPLDTEEKLATLLALTGLARVLGGYEAELLSARENGTEPRLTVGALSTLVTDDRFPALAPIVRAGEYTPDETQMAFEGPVMDAEYRFSIDRVLDGVEQLVAARGGATPADPASASAEGQPESAVTQELSDQQVRAVHKDPEVRAAVRMRREAETRLRETTKREQELVRRAAERVTRR
ncbi:TetR/AcrR family transcriptional regulator [Nakamurella leprariae]|nr:TetR family transcriptional regulator [Nakamurella leprariae]